MCYLNPDMASAFPACNCTDGSCYACQRIIQYERELTEEAQRRFRLENPQLYPDQQQEAKQ